MLDMGSFSYAGEAETYLIKAGKQTITAWPTSSLFSSIDSFAMTRAGNIDLAILGAMQVAANGANANWTIPGKMLKGLGGAMDLVAGVRRVVAVMEHDDKTAVSKIRDRCTLSLSGPGVVNLIVTDLCVFACDKQNGGLTLLNVALRVTLEKIGAKTAADFAAIT